MRNPRERIRNSRGYKWWILSLVMLGTFMAVMDVTVVNVGLPTIMSVFHIPISTAEWVITAYMITMTLMLPSAGWIADRIGNKRMYILGLVLFTFGSWLCGRAGSDMFLISARALQGFGSGIIQSLGLAIVTREFPPQQRGLALGLWSVAAAASISFGPPDRRLPGGRLQLAPDLRCERPGRSGGDPVGYLHTKGVARGANGEFRLARFPLRGLFHAFVGLRPRAR